MQTTGSGRRRRAAAGAARRTKAGAGRASAATGLGPDDPVPLPPSPDAVVVAPAAAVITTSPATVIAPPPADLRADTPLTVRPPTAVPADVLKQFRVIFRSVKKHFQVIERKCGIGGSQLWALATIARSPGIRVSDLAHALSVHQSTASNLVEQMVRLGLITRERDEDDQRVVHLKATARGSTLIERAPQPLTGILPDALSQLDPAEVQRLHAALQRLLEVMRVRDETATLTPLADI